ncbi:MAG: ATP-binding protein [Deltaproteobacteria bacterium]|nr:ATP-binding protein [Deltaproteobacteria bacterium]
MPNRNSSIVNIALVGGRGLCKELLEKTTFDYMQEGVDAPILAVADQDPSSPGMERARELGLLTFQDYHRLYDPSYNIHLIIILTPGPQIFNDILATRPPRIRIMSHEVFEVFWNAIASEERKLRVQKTAMETILNGIQDFILVITPEMEITEVNESFLKKTGLTREEVIGRKCHHVYGQLNHVCDNPNLICPLEEVVRNKTQCRQVQSRKDANGRTRHFEVNVYPIWENRGRISKFIHISRDITRRFKEEEELTRRLEKMVEERTRQLKESHAKLLHQDKMASLGKLAASVVHEINNPIAGVLNLILLIQRIIAEGPLQENDVEKFCQYLDLMEKETRRISKIVSNLLAFSRQSRLELKQLNINRLVDKTLILNANLLKINRVKVAKILDPDVPDVIGSEDQLQQVFMNLISNAVEAMEGRNDCALTIETRHDPGEGRIVVDFTDTGVGIPKDNYPKIFEPFFTTKKNGKAVGLGLSVVYGIVKEHGGFIYAASGPNGGTKFQVNLPLKRASAPAEISGGFDG